VIVDSSGQTNADILCVDGEIVSIGQRLARPPSGEVVDAAGLFVLPGGVDVHTHFDQPIPGARAADDFASGGDAGVAGGVTTHIDMCFQSPGQTLREAADAWHGLARGKALLDYGLHLVVVDPASGIPDIPWAVEQGYGSIKLFMAYPHLMVGDDELYDVFRACAAAGALPLVHCENGKVIQRLANEYVKGGSTEPRFHALSRPAWLEAEAVERCATLAHLAGSAVHIVHVSSIPALNAVRRARGCGRDISSETQPHYLTLSDEVYDQPGFETAKYVCSPPIRTEADRRALWRGLVNHDLDMIASDHLPFDLEDRRRLGASDFRSIPNGIGGIEYLRPALWDGGVRTGLISPERFVELTSVAPARRFGLQRKGRIAVGLDADLVIWDPDLTVTPDPAWSHSRTDYELYAGLTFQGGARVTVRRGQVLWDGSSVTGEHGSGRFVPRHIGMPDARPTKPSAGHQHSRRVTVGHAE